MTGAEREEIASILDAIDGLLSIARKARPEVADAIVALVSPVQRRMSRQFAPPGVDAIAHSPLLDGPVRILAVAA